MNRSERSGLKTSCHSAPKRRTKLLVVLVAVITATQTVAQPAPTSATQGGYSDIGDAGPHRPAVARLAEQGVLDGTDCGPGKFCPEEPIPRWVMAVWLVRVLEEAEPQAVDTSRFSDVEATAWWAPYVERIADLGITRGCSLDPALFCPTEAVTRAQMASFLVRAFQLPPGPSGRFTDTIGNTHQTDIEALVAAGITIGCSTEPALYCPTADTTRAQMATFLTRAIDYRADPTQIGGSSFVSGDFSAITSGERHICGLAADRTVSCWGDNLEGQAEAPEGEFLDIAAGSDYTCGIRTDGLLTCWGNLAGLPNPPDDPFTDIAVGTNHACAIGVDRTIRCWGHHEYGNNHGQSSPPPGEFTAIEIGDRFSCALRTDRTIACWGRNLYGETESPPGEFTALATNYARSCAVRTDQAVLCWGAGGEVLAPPVGEYAAVAVGGSHACGILTDQSVVCWGRDKAGVTIPPEGKFTSLSAGWLHSCGLRADGTVLCWGEHRYSHAATPTGAFIALDAGDRHSCAIRSNQAIACWGLNRERVTEAPFGRFTAVSAGAGASCAIRTDQTLTCWGDSGFAKTSPPGGRFIGIAAAGSRMCALGSDKTIVCWGSSEAHPDDPPQGEFLAMDSDGPACGIRTDNSIECWTGRSSQLNPPDGRFTSISAGGSHLCAMRTDRTVACWGRNPHGQTDAPAGEFIAVSAGGNHSCGVRSDRTVACWGANDHGQTDAPAGGFIAVSAGGNHSCGVRADQTLTCWGLQAAVAASAGAYHVSHPSPSADPGSCRPQGGSGAVTAGFPLPASAAPSTGAVRVAVLFVDFPNAQAVYSTHREAEQGLPFTEEYLEAVSYGQMDIEFVPHHKWLRAEERYEHYFGLFGDEDPLIRALIDQVAARLADPEFDFTGFSAVLVVMPSSHFGGGNAHGTVVTDEGRLGNTSRINTVPLTQQSAPRDWSITGAHELLHSLGLPDLYPYDPTFEHTELPGGYTWGEASFGLMGLKSLFPVSVRELPYFEALEMVAWSRWQLGWLDETQIRCITGQRATVTLSPVADPGTGIAMAAIPVSEAKLIVIESRRRLGFDGTTIERRNGRNITIQSTMPEGVLVYTVDASGRSGYLPIAVGGHRVLEGSPILAEGQKITIEGVTITVDSASPTTHTVTVTR